MTNQDDRITRLRDALLCGYVRTGSEPLMQALRADEDAADAALGIANCSMVNGTVPESGIQPTPINTYTKKVSVLPPTTTPTPQAVEYDNLHPAYAHGPAQTLPRGTPVMLMGDRFAQPRIVHLMHAVLVEPTDVPYVDEIRDGTRTMRYSIVVTDDAGLPIACFSANSVLCRMEQHPDGLKGLEWCIEGVATGPPASQDGF